MKKIGWILNWRLGIVFCDQPSIEISKFVLSGNLIVLFSIRNHQKFIEAHNGFKVFLNYLASPFQSFYSYEISCLVTFLNLFLVHVLVLLYSLDKVSYS